MNGEGKITNVESNGIFGHVVALVVVMIWGGTFVNTRVLIDKGLSPEEIYVLRTLLLMYVYGSFRPRNCSATR